MSKVSITRSLLDDLAMSISAKSGEAVPMTLVEMKDAVDSIQTGGSPTLQTKTKTYTPTTSQQTESVSADNGYDGLDTVSITVNAMPTGTAGTPTATKGTVSNHQVSVTPSVTNTSGYISGGTKTGTAVTVTASELVSGSETKTENGTYDVTNLAELVVNVSGGGSVTQDQNGYIVLPSTGGGGGGATQHTIHLEFSDSTDTDISVYYDDSLLGTMITAYEPSTWTYSSKTVTLAQLDNVTWYDKQSIPIGVELIDYNACLDDYAINSSGQAVSQQWYVASDYTPIESGMTFSFRGCRWFYLAYYDSSEGFISSSNIDNISTPDPNDSNVGIGTLSSDIPANAKYIRITGTGAYSSRLSLIRTA